MRMRTTHRIRALQCAAVDAGRKELLSGSDHRQPEDQDGYPQRCAIDVQNHKPFLGWTSREHGKSKKRHIVPGKFLTDGLTQALYYYIVTFQGTRSYGLCQTVCVTSHQASSVAYSGVVDIFLISFTDCGKILSETISVWFQVFGTTLTSHRNKSLVSVSPLTSSPPTQSFSGIVHQYI